MNFLTIFLSVALILAIISGWTEAQIAEVATTALGTGMKFLDLGLGVAKSAVGAFAKSGQ